MPPQPPQSDMNPVNKNTDNVANTSTLDFTTMPNTEFTRLDVRGLSIKERTAYIAELQNRIGKARQSKANAEAMTAAFNVRNIPIDVSLPTKDLLPLTTLSLLESNIKVDTITNPHNTLSVKSATDTQAGIYEYPEFTEWLRPSIQNKEIQVTISLSKYKLKQNTNILSMAEQLNYGTYSRGTDGKPIPDTFTPNPSNMPFTKEEVIHILSATIASQSELNPPPDNIPKTKSPFDTDGYPSIFLIYDYQTEKDRLANKKSLFTVNACWGSDSRRWFLDALGGSVGWGAGRSVFSRN